MEATVISILQHFSNFRLYQIMFQKQIEKAFLTLTVGEKNPEKEAAHP